MVTVYKVPRQIFNSMMFCPKCGKLMKSRDGKLTCAKCGYAEEISSAENEHMKKVAYMHENDILIVDDDMDI